MKISELEHIMYERYGQMNLENYLVDNIQMAIPSKLVGKKLSLHLDVIGRDISPGDIVSFSTADTRNVIAGILLGYTQQGFRVMAFGSYQAHYSSRCKYKNIFISTSVCLVQKMTNVIIEA